MRIDLGFSPLLLGLALAVACSDDGFINQSTGQAETSTSGNASTGGPTGLTASVDPGTTSGVDEGSSASPPASTSGNGGEATVGTTTDIEVASTSTGPEPGTDTDTTDTGTDTGTDTEGSTTGGPDPCAEGCAVELMCGTEWMSEEDCVTWCEANLVMAGAFSPFCRLAWEGVSACLGTLTCEEFAQWENPMMFPYPCSDADVVLEVECEGQ
jgi:hypothetical protein